MKILLVDADEYYHQKFQETFSPDFDIIATKQGTQVGNLIRRHNPHAVVMDLLLPDVSGYEVLEDIKSNRSTRNLPIIIFSRIDNLEDAEAVLRFGAIGCFVKGRDRIEDIRQLVVNNSIIKTS